MKLTIKFICEEENRSLWVSASSKQKRAWIEFFWSHSLSDYEWTFRGVVYAKLWESF
jgi:hypothetical protein